MNHKFSLLEFFYSTNNILHFMGEFIPILQNS